MNGGGGAAAAADAAGASISARPTRIVQRDAHAAAEEAAPASSPRKPKATAATAASRSSDKKSAGRKRSRAAAAEEKEEESDEAEGSPGGQPQSQKESRIELVAHQNSTRGCVKSSQEAARCIGPQCCCPQPVAQAGARTIGRCGRQRRGGEAVREDEEEEEKEEQWEVWKEEEEDAVEEEDESWLPGNSRSDGSVEVRARRKAGRSKGAASQAPHLVCQGRVKSKEGAAVGVSMREIQEWLTFVLC